jgi:hypothetical protein
MMHALSDSELLDAWERGLAQAPVQRALTLLAAACPETTLDALAELAIGQRDACLLRLRERIFGPRLSGLAACPACGDRVELAFDIADIRVTSEADPNEQMTLHLDGYEVRFRLPNSVDLIAIAGRGDSARDRLFERCLVAAQQNGEVRTAAQLSAHLVDAMIARMAQADPLGDIQLAIACPACGHQWQVPFDIVMFFWSEINAWARRIVSEVHTLALAYGWREADILAMSPARRQLYLSMVSG